MKWRASGLLWAGVFLGAVCSGAQKKPVELEDLDRHPAGPHAVDPVWAPDGKSFVFEDAGNLSLFDVGSRTRRDLIPIAILEQAAKAAAPGAFDWTNRRVAEKPIQWFEARDRILVIEGGDLFLVYLNAAEPGHARFEQLTATPEQEQDPKLSPDNKFVSFRRLHDLYVFDLTTKKTTRLTSDGSETLLNGQLDWVYPEELDLSTAHWWSPDSKHIAYLQFDTHREPLFPEVALLKAEPVLEPERFPKAGDPNAEVRLGVVAAEGGETTWMSLGETQDHLLARVTWLPDSSAVAAMRLNRIQNRLDLLRADIRTGQSSTLIHEEDPYWINVKDEPYFFRDGRGFLWESERDGSRHLYFYGRDGKLPRQLTSGKWVVQKLEAVDEPGGKIYYSSNEGSPVESHLYELDLKNAKRTRLTPGAGMHHVSVAPQGAYFTDRFSSLSTPPSQVIRGRDGSEVMTWAAPDTTISQEFALSTPEMVQVKSNNGDVMYARLIKPIPFDPSKKYPVVVEVYGGPDVQVVSDAWTGLNVEQLLASKGYVVWQMDNHGSSGRGHAWESVVFRDLGRHELEDQRTGVEYLKTLGYVDGSRIGLFGWSYGGFMTLYSMVNAPDLFRAGISGAPVTNWRNYDSIYTERYMGLPEDNASAYEQSSPQTKAAQLRGKLLLLHNFEDDNVHFANTLQMASALELADRPFRMLIFPQKSHGVYGGYAKSLHATILAFFEENLK